MNHTILTLALVSSTLTLHAAGPGASTPRSSARAGATAPAVAQATPGAPDNLTVLAQSGGTVTLGWTPPAAGAAPTGYVLEGGLAPGEVIASIPTVGTAPRATLEVPTGAFFVRVHAVVGAERGQASNEIPLFVGVPEPPSAPANLLGMVSGSSLALSWTNTFAGGVPTEQWLSVGGAISAVLALPPGDSFAYSGVPPGTYTLSVIASNASGVSAPSNAVTLTLPAACSGPPGAPVDFQAWQQDSTIFVSWRPPASGPAVTSYTVRVSGAAVATVETTSRMIAGTVGPGEYAISVVANNACGHGRAAPAAPEWTAAVTQGANRLVHWRPTPGAAGYRVYWSTSRQAVQTLSPTVSFADVTSPPLLVPAGDPTQPVYYRVHTTHGPVVSAGGPLAVATTFDRVDYPDWAGSVTPALFDANEDGCLDMVGAWGTCDGLFQRYPLEAAGLEGLAAVGRSNRDSRFADFTGDGIIDIFTNVYAQADDPLSSAMLHVGNGHGGFTEDPGVSAMQIRGFGETVLAADFDNDGDVDIFVPTYTHRGDGGHNWLLINDGTGHFTDVAESAGVAVNLNPPPEGAQAIDINQDGWIDIHVASHLFINNGNLTFTDQASALGMPILFDEGMRLFDVDLDGDFDLVHHDSHVTRLYTNDQGTFGAGVTVDGDPEGSTIGYGLNVCDINGDGFEDVLVANNRRDTGIGHPHLLLNIGGALVPSDWATAPAVYNDLLACADLDRSGLPDVIDRWTEEVTSAPSNPTVRLVRYRTYLNRGATDAPIRLRIVGAGGARNQQGRIVRVRPLDGPDRTLLRVVESGSGYMAQNGYDLLVATPWGGDYEVAVRFATGWVRTTARAGDELTIYANGAVVPTLR